MDPTVAKRNAQAEARLKELRLPPLQQKSIDALQKNLQRTAGRRALIEKVARQHGVDPDELYMKFVIETRGSDDPENPGVSPKGAKGPFQMKDDIRAKFEDRSIKDPFVREATTAAKFYSDLQKRNKFESHAARSAAYNFGEGNLREWAGSAPKELNDETTNYIAYSKYLEPIFAEKRSKERTAGAAAAVPPPPKLEELGPLEYAKRKLTGTLRTPEQFEQETAAYHQQVDAARTAPAKSK
jgi:transposase-like protein